MMKQMTLKAIAAACGGTYYGPAENLEKEVAGIAIDSRKIETGWLFAVLEKKLRYQKQTHTFRLHLLSRH